MSDAFSKYFNGAATRSDLRRVARGGMDFYNF